MGVLFDLSFDSGKHSRQGSLANLKSVSTGHLAFYLPIA